ncbi:MAG: gamma-glutamyltransferase [Sneathiella sp.]|uniref:gamma-glutamyltransferase family protein n=1 Tax=Sneathiella sp. TaxID=1964365 RepID=UPI000C39D8E4|nr:gamma-glutamyltransferase [Sneathiella sp.]MAZ04316.1 gamma-glutamyltransferase [Sneathiella sp.]
MARQSGAQTAATKDSYAVSVGHDVAAEIARDVLEAGGNAVDAGVAASVALTVLHSEQVQFGGVAPILLYLADENRYISIEGAGRWPASATPDYFREKHRGRIPQGILRTVVPAAPDAWLTALARFGTMSFADLAAPAQALAADGFPAHDDLVSCSTQFERYYQRMSEDNARLWLPEGAPVAAGQIFRLPELAKTIGLLIDADRNAARKSGRAAGLQAVHDVFYEGEIAEAMIRHVQACDGWLTRADLTAHRTPVVEATGADVFGGRLYTPASWTQGPALSQALQILDSGGIARLAPQSVEACHMVIEALKLALVDREAYYGDPDFVDVPMEALLSPAYAATRAALIDMAAAIHPLPPAGDIAERSMKSPPAPAPDEEAMTLDTSVAAVIDGAGNIFASTPSDPSFDGPVVPELGFVISTRGAQSYVEAGHPACLAAEKRPRVSAYPMIFRGANGRHIAGGGPGADLQLQAMTQVLASHLAHDLGLSEATKAPRVFTHGVPASTEPHLSFAGKVVIEDELPETTLTALAALGHKASHGKASGIAKPSICLVARDPDGALEAVGDPRRASGQHLKQGARTGKAVV